MHQLSPTKSLPLNDDDATPIEIQPEASAQQDDCTPSRPSTRTTGPRAPPSSWQGQARPQGTSKGSSYRRISSSRRAFRKEEEKGRGGRGGGGGAARGVGEWSPSGEEEEEGRGRAACGAKGEADTVGEASGEAGGEGGGRSGEEEEQGRVDGRQGDCLARGQAWSTRWTADGGEGQVEGRVCG